MSLTHEYPCVLHLCKYCSTPRCRAFPSHSPYFLKMLGVVGVVIAGQLVENAVRPTAVGKKNWLFVGHPDAGQRSAILYSATVSCLRHQHAARS